MLKRILFAFLVCLAFGQTISARKLERSEIDSIAQAITVIYQHQLQARADARGEAFLDAPYTEGITTIIGTDTTQITPERYDGLYNGAIILGYVENVERNSNIKIDRKKFIKAFVNAAKAKSKKFDSAKAKSFLNRMSGKNKFSKAEIDSFPTALAAVYVDNFNLKSSKSSGGKANEAYLEGIAELFDASFVNPSFYHGVRDGVILTAAMKDIEKTKNLPVNREKMVLAFKRAAKGRSNRFTPQTAERYIAAITTAVNADEKVYEESLKFLEEIQNKPGVKSDRTGIMWEIIKEGEQKPWTITDNDVVVTYTGTLYNGKIFDSSHSEKPVRFNPRQLIPGFSYALQHMTPGSTIRVYIPSSLGYGEMGVPGTIPPNAALVFDITLHEVIPHNPINNN